MTRLLLAGAAIVSALVFGGIQAGLIAPFAASAEDASTLKRFASAAEFERYLQRLQRERANEPTVMFDVAESAASPPSLQMEPTASANPEITNNQTVGVDEGGIVKQIGRFLVVLQDGRLFSADLGDGPGAPLRLTDRIDVYRSRETAADWYDEMLVLGDRILVTAYSYREAASEITVIRLGPDGRMRREGRFLLDSSDYYSTENYATRLVGDRLVFYAPLALETLGPGAAFRWPRLRRADGDREAGEGEALIGPTDVYAPIGEVERPVLHTLSICPLRGEMDCTTTAFVGPPLRELYVSPTDAFLWIGAPDGLPWGIDYAQVRRLACPGGWRDGSDYRRALIYRVPLEGGDIGAVAAEGVPSDQFAFDSRDGRFRALLADAAGRCPGREGHSLDLLDLPLSAFAAEIRTAPEAAYTSLPPAAGPLLENRFVGNWLVYGGREDWSGFAQDAPLRAQSGQVVAVPLERPSEAVRLAVPHSTIRIERAGSDAVVTGYRDATGLSLSYLSLDGRPRRAATAVLARRVESEGRSHAFNAWVRSDGSGLIGLPTSERVWRADRSWSDSETSALTFVAIGRDKALAPVGELVPRQGRAAGGYRCEVSCIDWYGNSRPIFTGGRVFALMGTDLVEGRVEGGRIAELSRVDLTAEPIA